MHIIAAIHAPLDHVSTIHNKTDINEITDNILGLPLCDAIRKYMENGNTNTRYIAKTLGLSNSDTARPLMS